MLVDYEMLNFWEVFRIEAHVLYRTVELVPCIDRPVLENDQCRPSTWAEKPYDLRDQDDINWKVMEDF